MPEDKTNINPEVETPQWWKKQGLLLKGQGNLDEAIPYFQKVIQNYPRDAEAFFYLGNIFVSKKEIPRAIRCFEQGLQFDPNNVNLLYGMANALREKHCFQEAIQMMERAIGLYSESFELQNFLGGLYHQVKQIDKAIEYYRTALALNSRAIGVYYNLGKALEENGLVAEALKVYRRALQTSVADSPLYEFFDRLESDYPLFENKFKKIEGFLFALEGFTLMILAAKGAGEGQVVEIGSFMGKSTCWLATGSKEAGREKVTAIDHFKGSPEHRDPERVQDLSRDREWTTLYEFNKNIKLMGLDDYIQPIVSDSQAVTRTWNQPIRLLFIDGDHSYESSKKDFESWSPFVIPRGMVVFHDIEVWDGVTKFYKELKNTSEEYMEIFSVMSLRVMEKNISKEG